MCTNGCWILKRFMHVEEYYFDTSQGKKFVYEIYITFHFTNVMICMEIVISCINTGKNI